MKYLESIKLVQFFLFEKQEIRLQEITGIFGPNASGKSSLVDAVQIAMFGANARLVSLNAQADERTTTRTIRSYCLGMHDETKRARDNCDNLHHFAVARLGDKRTYLDGGLSLRIGRY